jgi:hypothetical protein
MQKVKDEFAKYTGTDTKLQVYKGVIGTVTMTDDATTTIFYTSKGVLVSPTKTFPTNEVTGIKVT